MICKGLLCMILKASIHLGGLYDYSNTIKEHSSITPSNDLCCKGLHCQHCKPSRNGTSARRPECLGISLYNIIVRAKHLLKINRNILKCIRQMLRPYDNFSDMTESRNNIRIKKVDHTNKNHTKERVKR